MLISGRKDQVKKERSKLYFCVVVTTQSNWYFYFLLFFISSFFNLSLVSLAVLIMCLFINTFMYKKRIIGFEKSSSTLKKLIGGAMEMRRNRYLNLITKVLDSRKSCRRTKCHLFILTNSFKRRRTRWCRFCRLDPLNSLLMEHTSYFTAWQLWWTP